MNYDTVEEEGLMHLQKVSAQFTLRSPRRLTWPKLFVVGQFFESQKDQFTLRITCLLDQMDPLDS